jgi:hypothetical protein
MTNDPDVRHYEGWSHDAHQEVTAEAAAELPFHATARYGPEGRLERHELYEGRTLRRVDYHTDDDEDAVRAAHQQNLARCRS